MYLNMPDHQQRLHARVFGHVQGVNFRFYTRQTAAQIGVKGWVRNRVDGSVEVMAEATPDKLEKFLQFLNKGPESASVSWVETDWLSATGEFIDFRIN
jgi:acylphosphatase